MDKFNLKYLIITDLKATLETSLELAKTINEQIPKEDHVDILALNEGFAIIGNETVKNTINISLAKRGHKNY